MHVCFLVFSHLSALLSLVYCVHMNLRLTGEDGWCVGVFYLSSGVLKRPALIWCYYNKREDSLLPATSCTHLFKMNSTKSDSYFPNPVFCLVLSNQSIFLLKDLIFIAGRGRYVIVRTFLWGINCMYAWAFSNVHFKRTMLVWYQDITEKEKKDHSQSTNHLRDPLSLSEPHWPRGNGKVLWKQVELELVPVIILAVEVSADSRSSL